VTSATRRDDREEEVGELEVSTVWKDCRPAVAPCLGGTIDSRHSSSCRRSPLPTDAVVNWSRVRGCRGSSAGANLGQAGPGQARPGRGHGRAQRRARAVASRASASEYSAILMAAWRPNVVKWRCELAGTTVRTSVASVGNDL